MGDVRVLGAGRLLKDDEEVDCYACRAVLRMHTYRDSMHMCISILLRMCRRRL